MGFAWGFSGGGAAQRVGEPVRTGTLNQGASKNILAEETDLTFGNGLE
jgi:hypothetical protein